MAEIRRVAYPEDFTKLHIFDGFSTLLKECAVSECLPTEKPPAGDVPPGRYRDILPPRMRAAYDAALRDLDEQQRALGPSLFERLARETADLFINGGETE